MAQKKCGRVSLYMDYVFLVFLCLADERFTAGAPVLDSRSLSVAAGVRFFAVGLDGEADLLGLEVVVVVEDLEVALGLELAVGAAGGLESVVVVTAVTGLTSSALGVAEGVASATAGFCSGWFSCLVPFEGLCKSPIRTEPIPPEMAIRSQRGMRTVTL